MNQPVYEGASRLNFTSTQTLTPTATVLQNGIICGIFVASCSATPTLKVADTVGTIVNTFTPIAGTFYPMPCMFSGTLTITVGGTIDATLFYGYA